MVCFLQATEGSLHFSIDTMSGTYPIDHYLSLLKVGGMMVLLSFPSEIKVQAANLNLSNVSFTYIAGQIWKEEATKGIEMLNLMFYMCTVSIR